MKFDTFTQAYLEAAFWSSTESPYKECASCGKDKVICQFDTEGGGPEWTICADCGGDSQGNHSEPPLEDNYGIAHLSPKTLAAMVADCAKFQAENDLAENSDKQAGFDFWLTRNGHGTGFWDGDWEESGDRLTAASKVYGEFNLYVGDDGVLYHV